MNAATELADEIEDEGAGLTFIIVADEERELIVKALRAYASAPQADLAGAVDSGTPPAVADPLDRDDIEQLREDLLNMEGWLPEGKARLSMLCDMALAALSDIDSEGR